MSKLSVLAIGVLAVACIPAAAAATTSRAPLFQNQSRTAICGLEIHASRSPLYLLCEAPGVPRAKHGVGDPAVRLTRTGRPELVLISQDSYSSNTLKTLANGAAWKSIGVTCLIGSHTIRCSNTNKHGFTIGNGKYKPF